MISLMPRFLLLLALFALLSPLRASDPTELKEARAAYEKSATPTEAQREQYIAQLAHLRDHLVKSNRVPDAFAVDAEVMKHPAPSDPATAKTLAHLILGKWRSPRHDYLFRKDGTWTMLPVEEDGAANTNGEWQIKGNQFDDSDGSPYTILLLDADNFIYTDGKYVFYEKRLKDK